MITSCVSWTPTPNTLVIFGNAMFTTFYTEAAFEAAYDGLIKKYTKPFSPQVHDAVNEGDYVWTQFIDNQILPVGMKK